MERIDLAAIAYKIMYTYEELEESRSKILAQLAKDLKLDHADLHKAVQKVKEWRV